MLVIESGQVDMASHDTRLLSVLQKNDKRGAIYQKNVDRRYR